MPRKSPKGNNKRPYKPYTEEDLLNAIAEREDEGVSLRKLAEKYNIPRQTLSNKVNIFSMLIC